MSQQFLPGHGLLNPRDVGHWGPAHRRLGLHHGAGAAQVDAALGRHGGGGQGPGGGGGGQAGALDGVGEGGAGARRSGAASHHVAHHQLGAHHRA